MKRYYTISTHIDNKTINTYNKTYISTLENFMSSITSRLRDHFLYLGQIPRHHIEAMTIKDGKLVASFLPNKIENTETGMGDRRLTPLSISGGIEDSLINEAIHAVMNKMRKNFGSLIQECKIALNEGNDATVLIVENHKIFEDYIENISKEIVALNAQRSIAST